MNRVIFTTALVLISISQSAPARSGYTEGDQVCHNAIVDAMGKASGMNRFSYRRNDPEGLIVSGVCKTSSDNGSITIGAFVSLSPGHADQLTIAMVNNQNYAAVATYGESLGNSFTPIISTGRDMLRLDTARYDIAKGVRAFALDVIAGPEPNPYCGQDDGGTVRTLFVRDGADIRPLFREGLRISLRRYVQGDPRCAPVKSTASPSKTVTEDIKLTIAILDKATDGYANLMITAVSSYSDGTRSKRKPFRYEVQYHKQLYKNRDIGAYSVEDIREEFDEWLGK